MNGVINEDQSKLNQWMLRQVHLLTLKLKVMIKILYLKLVIMQEYQSIKIFLPKNTPKWPEKVLVIKKVKNTVPWAYVIEDLNSEEIVGMFYEQELQKTNQKEFWIEKVIRKKGNKSNVRWKGYDNSCNSLVDKKDIIKIK